MSQFDFPIVMTAAGAQPQAPADLLAQLISAVSATNPNYTANLPGSLVEDISSTDVFAITMCDQARVELLNSLTPLGANAFLLSQLGQIYGVDPGVAVNTSVQVVFSGTPGYVVSQGFAVSDGTHQYVTQSGAVIQSGGYTESLTAVATATGAWAVPANSVTELVTTVPTGVSLSVSNPLAGTPGGTTLSEEQYRSAVLAAGLAASTGMASLLKTLLTNVSGVQPRLVSVRQSTSGWEVIVGGNADNYAVAYAIYSAVFDISSLVGSEIKVIGATNASPGVFTTDLNHGYSTDQTVTVSGSTPSAFNRSYTITVLSPTTFSVGVNTSGFGTYVSGGVCTPNARNIKVSVNDYPDVYNVTFVSPPQQSVAISVTWNTLAANFTGAPAVAQLAAPAMITYINSIPVGTPINLLELTATFQTAVSSVLPSNLLTRLVFAVSLNGVSVLPEAGESYIQGDPESYFYASPTAITVTQG